LTGSNQSGRKRRFASRHIQDVGCFRIPKNTKIFVSVAVEMHFLQNESDYTETSLPLRGGIATKQSKMAENGSRSEYKPLRLNKS
jgi:hypothetical protein